MRSEKTGVVFMLLVSMILMVSITCGCSKEEATPPEGGSDSPDDPLPGTIGIATSAVGTGGHSMAVGYSSAMEEILERPVRIFPADSTQVNISQILSGRAIFIGGGHSQNNAGDALEAYEAYANHEWGPQEVGFVWYLCVFPYAVMVRGDSDAEKIEDLAGRKAAVYYSSPAWYRGLEACLKFGGLSFEDVEVIEFGGYTQCQQAVADGRADFTFTSTISSVTYEVAENPHGIKFIPMPVDDEEAWDRYYEDLPLGNNGYCESGVESAIGVPMPLSPFIMYTLKSVPEETIYEIAKFFAENFDAYKDAHPQMVEMGLDTVLEFKDTGLGIPVHPGTVKYFKEIGKWTEEDEQWNNAQWEKVKKMREAWDAAVDEANEKGIKIVYNNEEWIKLWEQHRSSVEPFMRRASLK
jgi:TRAP transporter TAXI family solute receptor